MFLYSESRQRKFGSLGYLVLTRMVCYMVVHAYNSRLLRRLRQNCKFQF